MNYKAPLAVGGKEIVEKSVCQTYKQHPLSSYNINTDQHEPLVWPPQGLSALK